MEDSNRLEKSFLIFPWFSPFPAISSLKRSTASRKSCSLSFKSVPEVRTSSPKTTFTTPFSVTTGSVMGNRSSQEAFSTNRDTSGEASPQGKAEGTILDGGAVVCLPGEGMLQVNLFPLVAPVPYLSFYGASLGSRCTRTYCQNEHQQGTCLWQKTCSFSHLSHLKKAVRLNRFSGTAFCYLLRKRVTSESDTELQHRHIKNLDIMV